MQPVGLQADIAPDISITALADLIFAERVKVFSVYTTKHQTKKKRYSSGYSFSILGPARDDQVARAACQEQIPSLQDDLGPDEPLQPEDRRISKYAFLVLPAAQAKQWMDSPPRGVISLQVTNLVSEDTLSRDEQVMRNVLTLQMSTTEATQVPAGCEKYLSISVGAAVGERSK